MMVWTLKKILLTVHLRYTTAPIYRNCLMLNTGSEFMIWSSIWAIKSLLTVRKVTANCQVVRVSQESQNPCQESQNPCPIRSQAKYPGLFGLLEVLGKCTPTWLLSNYFCQCQKQLDWDRNPEILLGQS